MSAPLTIVARIEARPGCEEKVEASLRALIAPTLREDGCLQYDLHRDNEHPGRFLFYENWESRPQWQAHMESAHLKAHQEATADLVADFELFEMTLVRG
jgi:quinol monooxygenase YgiN